MAKKAAANVGQASRLFPKSGKNETGRVPVLSSSPLSASHYVKEMLDQILQLPPVVQKFAEREGLGALGKSAEIRK